MKKYIFVAVGLSILSILLAGCGTSKTPTTDTNTKTLETLRNSQPQTRVDITGTVKTVIGNVFTVEMLDMSGSEIFKEMQDTDFRTKMQSMTDAERQAWMTKMQEARASAKRVLVDVTIPAGIPILVRTNSWGGMGGWFMRGAGAAPWQNSGIGSSLNTNTQQQATTQSQNANAGKQGTLADIKVGSTVTIWLSENTTERKIASWVTTSSWTWNSSGGMGFWWGENRSNSGTGGNSTPPPGL